MEKRNVTKKDIEKAIYDSYIFNHFIDYLVDKQYHDVEMKPSEMLNYIQSLYELEKNNF